MGEEMKMREAGTANKSTGGEIPYHQAYFGCCNRTVMTREDIAQPKFCPFCGKQTLDSKVLHGVTPTDVSLKEAAQELLTYLEVFQEQDEIGWTLAKKMGKVKQALALPAPSPGVATEKLEGLMDEHEHGEDCSLVRPCDCWLAALDALIQEAKGKVGK